MHKGLWGAGFFNAGRTRHSGGCLGGVRENSLEKVSTRMVAEKGSTNSTLVTVAETAGEWTGRCERGSMHFAHEIPGEGGVGAGGRQGRQWEPGTVSLPNSKL